MSVYRVFGDLILKGCPQLTLNTGNWLEVRGDLTISGLSIKSLPKHLRVHGNLRIENCRNLNALPDGLDVDGNLIVINTPIESITDLVTVRGSIAIKRCRTFQRFAARFDFKKNLSLIKCGIQSLPVGMTIPGRLTLIDCDAIPRLPMNSEVGFGIDARRWDKVLTIRGCKQLNILPTDMRVAAAIDLIDSHLTDVPQQLSGNHIQYKGVLVPRELVFAPERLSVEDVLLERNAEVRRLMLDRIGCNEVMRRAAATLVDQDTDAGGERTLYDVGLQGRSMVQHRYLLCHCPSTGRQYLLGVPPEVGSCNAAAAWLAGFDDPGDYRPVQET